MNIYQQHLIFLESRDERLSSVPLNFGPLLSSPDDQTPVNIALPTVSSANASQSTTPGKSGIIDKEKSLWHIKTNLS